MDSGVGVVMINLEWPSWANCHVIDVDGVGHFMGGGRPVVSSVLGKWLWPTSDEAGATSESGVRSDGSAWQHSLQLRPQ